jgi:hypothetical protein
MSAKRDCIIVLLPTRNRQPEKSGGRNSAKLTPVCGGLSQKWLLKMELEGQRRTLRAWENHLKMFHRLQQRIGLQTEWSHLLAAQPGANRVQLPAQVAPQPVECLQCERRSQRLHRSLERKARQQFYQPPPYHRSRDRVARQNLRQTNGKSAPTTTALSAVGAENPLAPDTLAVGLPRIVASQQAVPV